MLNTLAIANKLQQIDNKLEILNEKVIKLQGKAEGLLETLKVKNGRTTKKNN
jgi:hypothetical protein